MYATNKIKGEQIIGKKHAEKQAFFGKNFEKV